MRSVMVPIPGIYQRPIQVVLQRPKLPLRSSISPIKCRCSAGRARTTRFIMFATRKDRAEIRTPKYVNSMGGGRDGWTAFTFSRFTGNVVSSDTVFILPCSIHHHHTPYSIQPASVTAPGGFRYSATCMIRCGEYFRSKSFKCSLHDRISRRRSIRSMSAICRSDNWLSCSVVRYLPANRARHFEKKSFSGLAKFELLFWLPILHISLYSL